MNIIVNSIIRHTKSGLCVPEYLETRCYPEAVVNVVRFIMFAI